MIEIVDLNTGETRYESKNYVPAENEQIVLPSVEVTPNKNKTLWWILGIAAAYYAFK